MSINKVWLLICSAWAAVGGTILYFLDHSLVGPVVWLVLGDLIGLFGPFFLRRFIEVIPHQGEGLPADPVFIAPLVGLIHGTLFGPLVGAWMGLEPGWQAWQGALLGALLVPPAFSLAVILVFSSLLPVRTSVPSSAVEREFGLTRLDRLFVALMCLVLPAVVLVVVARCALWVPRRRERLRVYGMVQERGGVFGADPDADRFYGVRWEGTAVGDAEAGQLRAFPELDYLALSWTRVTDEGLARLRGLRRLKIVDLSHTAVTDAGLALLGTLAGLDVLDLSGTAVGDAGIERLRGLANLKCLGLRGTRVTPAGVERLLARLAGASGEDVSRSHLSPSPLKRHRCSVYRSCTPSRSANAVTGQCEPSRYAAVALRLSLVSIAEPRESRVPT